jgi:hypothetical protein
VCSGRAGILIGSDGTAVVRCCVLIGSFKFKFDYLNIILIN